MKSNVTTGETQAMCNDLDPLLAHIVLFGLPLKALKRAKVGEGVDCDVPYWLERRTNHHL